MAGQEIVVGESALSASLVSHADVVSVTPAGGFQTFNSSSYNTGRVVTVEQERSFENASLTTSGSDATSSLLEDAPARENQYTVRFQLSGSGTWVSGSANASVQVLIPLVIQAPEGETVDAFSASFDFTLEAGAASSSEFSAIQSRSLGVAGLDDAERFRLVRGTHTSSFTTGAGGAASFSLAETNVRGGQRPEFGGAPGVAGVEYTAQRHTVLQAPPVDGRVWRVVFNS